MLVKMAARGIIINKHTYLRDGWNWLDFIVVIIACVSSPFGLLSVSLRSPFYCSFSFQSPFCLPSASLRPPLCLLFVRSPFCLLLISSPSPFGLPSISSSLGLPSVSFRPSFCLPSASLLFPGPHPAAYLLSPSLSPSICPSISPCVPPSFTHSLTHSVRQS